MDKSLDHLIYDGYATQTDSGKIVGSVRPTETKMSKKPEPEAFIGKVALALVAGEAQVIAAGPLTLQPSSRAYRIVMANFLGQFVVFSEIFRVEGTVENLAEACSKAQSDFDQGSYFPATELAEATVEFAKRVARHAEFIKSVYRPAA